ncbi:hypothetical protein VTI74DRAFT_8817 [Chaetomium olivicolor]
MDLTRMLNDSGPSASPLSKPPPPAQPTVPPPQQQQQPALPSTPVQTNPQHSFRDYSQPQPSPSRHISQDYHAQHLPSGPFASPPPYQGLPTGSYASRPQPQLQRLPTNDLRSPSLGPGPAPSPYRQTPSASLGNTGGYPFPPQQNTTSPVQRHQYPPGGPYHRDSYPPPAAPVGMAGSTGAYLPGPHVPQTPPVATPPAGHPYLHRSQSSQSTPTPTSAQSQAMQYGGAFPHGSPVTASRSLQQPEPQQRQPSQPPTPGGAMPLSARPAQAMPYSQPPSPYKQRLPTTGPHQASQTSPPPPPPPSLPGYSSSQSGYESHSQDSGRGPQLQGDRDQSLSVSPKTRVPSLPSSGGRPGTSVSEPEPRPNQPHPIPTMAERAATPAKRKLDDRELRPEELEKRDTRPPPFEDRNGQSAHPDAGSSVQRSTMPVKVLKRRVHQTIPPWAQSIKGRAPAHPNSILYKPVPHSGPQVNGKHDRQPPRPDRQPSRHPSPEEKRSMPPAAPAVPDVASQWGPLGPWEASITNEVPQEQFTKAVADFLFQNVILNQDMGEIQSRGVKFEIEAKLGMLIDKDRSQRLDIPVATECIIRGGGNWLGFRSSMTELQHKSFNEFLNQLVQLTHPANKAANATLPRPRLPIEYRHRHEIDRFFELPSSVRDRVLPVCVARPIASKGHGARVRVTHDQKTKQILAKIVKARVADLSLHFPDLPLDCRISVNLEMDWDGSVEELERISASTGRPPVPARTKDRLSYKHGCYQIDLTQVVKSMPGPGNTQNMEKEHELEVEVDPVPLIDQGRRAMEGQPHQYVEVIEGLVNNIRILARKAKESV